MKSGSKSKILMLTPEAILLYIKNFYDIPGEITIKGIGTSYNSFSSEGYKEGTVIVSISLESPDFEEADDALPWPVIDLAKYPIRRR